jgi:hypothetical protein
MCLKSISLLYFSRKWRFGSVGLCDLYVGLFVCYGILGTGATSGYGTAETTAAASYGGPGPQRGGSYSAPGGQPSSYHPYRRM